jgi:hypothetical protein
VDEEHGTAGPAEREGQSVGCFTQGRAPGANRTGVRDGG